MSTGDLRMALDMISASKNASFCGAQQESTIDAAEMLLSLRFPPTYREFLRQLGCGDVAGLEIFGIVDENLKRPGIPNGIWLTMDERQQSSAPVNLVFVSDTGDGGYYAIDLSRRNTDGESPVVLWWPGITSRTEDCEVVAEDFGTFLLTHVRAALRSVANDT